MRILYYSPHPLLSLNSPAGYATHMREMIRAFELLGHTVKPVILGDHSSPAADQAAVSPGGLKSTLKKLLPGIIWETVKDISLIRFDRMAASLLEKEITTFKPDLIYERSSYMQVSGMQTAKKMGIRHILEVNSPYVEERVVLGGRSLLLNYAKQRERIQLSDTSAVVVVSSALKNHFLKNYPIPADNYLITPNAINVNDIRLSGSGNTSKAGFNWSENDFLFGFVGSMFKWHGVDLLLIAFDRLQKKYDHVKLLIVGDGSIMNELRDYVTAADLSDSVHFTGSIPHQFVFDHIQLMDCTIMAKSNWYGSPIKIFEYGYLGKPIIAPNVSPVQDVLTHLQNAILVDPSADSLFEAMEWVLLNKNEAIEMGKRFQTKILNEHLWQHNARAVLASIK